ncbi:MarR family protein [Croceibacterium atlanticum]|uniref:MarR family protein n=3 Tax=Croceibacterium atlanticum TaxID=1267766 RepID=A0A0F7KNR2_9SPHN|nr:MarR family protein [Croceibacterium atlanticum]
MNNRGDTEAGDDPRIPDPLRSGQRTGPLARLLSMRMVVLFGFMRRSGVRTRQHLFDISETEWRILSQLGPFAPLSLNGLAELLAKDRGQLSRSVKSLVQRDLVTRRRKPGGPEIELGLTDKGKTLFDDMTELAIERDRRLTENIDPDDLAAAMRVVEQMILHAEKMLEENSETGEGAHPPAK